MPCDINETHDPDLTSWVESANAPGTDFPIQNLPLAVVVLADNYHPAVRIGDQALLLDWLAHEGLLRYPPGTSPYFDAAGWEVPLSALPPAASLPRWIHDLRSRLTDLLRAEGTNAGGEREACKRCLLPITEMEVALPFHELAGFTDFYASIHHASTVGSMFRPENPLLPNYRHVPIAYHGRASTIVPSGTPIRRPVGQVPPPDDNPAAGPSFGPTRMLDYELELGFFVGRGNEMGEPMPIDRAEDHILGVCLVNDWSARDIQKWEYQPLGPFLAKNFATTISPYVVTMEALAPFRCPAFERPPDDPRPLAYLHSDRDRRLGGIDITVEAHLASAEMRRRGLSPVRLSRGSFRHMYWTIAQMLTHHASNGCRMMPGDLLGSGTISGPEPASRGCLLELTWQGRGPDARPLPRRPVELPTGEKRLFLEDGDEVMLGACCEREGFRRIGLGECRGTIEPARR
jgi:fumarylacetoacetase